jgi:L-lactate dehydrogenase complex protein LldG
MSNPVLERIREALAQQPVPGHHTPTPSKLPSGTSRDDAFRAVLPAVGANPGEILALFAKNATDLRAVFHPVKNMAEAVSVLRELATMEKWDKIATHRGELTDAASAALGLPAYRTEENFDKNTLEKCPVGLTECDALVAHTGSVLVTSKSTGGRALTVLPPHHVVLARNSQLVAGLPDAFALVRKRYAGQFPSMISFITGPSRTGDIERILVLGAHGPKKLTILCIEDA